jgi:hypothetical protein
MKYLVANLEGHEAMFVFPRAVDHDRMAEALTMIRFGYNHNWERKLLPRDGKADGNIISAGFVDNGKCHGRSETLGLFSRGDADTELLPK